MPLPSRNASFQQGSFQGFRSFGPAKVENAFDARIHGRGGPIVPHSGRYFARLDGAGLKGSGLKLDSNGFRTGGRYASFRDYAFVDGYGHTIGGQGAWLICDDFDLDPGESLIFDWLFIISIPGFPDVRHNGFVAVRFIDEQGFDAMPMQTIVQARDLANAGPVGGVYQTGWASRQITWTGTQPFKGSVQWLVSSGHCLNSTDQQTDRDIARAWPACVLLDHIRLG